MTSAITSIFPDISFDDFRFSFEDLDQHLNIQLDESLFNDQSFLSASVPIVDKNLSVKTVQSSPHEQFFFQNCETASHTTGESLHEDADLSNGSNDFDISEFFCSKKQVSLQTTASYTRKNKDCNTIRLKKNFDQIQVLELEYTKDPQWDKTKMMKLSKKVGLTFSQVYKWHWDKIKLQSKYYLAARAQAIETNSNTIFRISKVERQ